MNKKEFSKKIEKYKKRAKVITICLVIVIIIYLIYSIIQGLKTPTSVEDFKSVKQYVEYMGSTYISEENTYPKQINLKFKYNLYNEDRTSNENYFNQMITGLATLLNYKDFYLSDDESIIYITVDCNSEDEEIESININGSENYFAENDTKNSISNYTKVNNISVNINSNILNSAIMKDWDYSESIFGLKDSIYNDYDIFFDEGIEVKPVSLGTDVSSRKRIFNIVFNEKYKEKIVNNLGTSSNLEEVISVFGESHFGSIDEGLIGYKTDRFYVFFNIKNEVSVYPYQSIEDNYFGEVIGKFVTNNDANSLLDELAVLYPFADKYEENSKLNSKELVYTLLGVKVQFNVSNEQGVVIYNNFSGNITESYSFEDVINATKKLPNNVYFKNTDLVYENESSRTFYSIDTQFMEQSDDFIIYSELYNDRNYRLKFISKNENYPNSELLNTVSYFKFIDNTSIAYSMRNTGLYVYNIAANTQTTLLEGNEEYNIKEIKNGKIYYDNKNIDIE